MILFNKYASAAWNILQIIIFVEKIIFWFGLTHMRSGRKTIFYRFLSFSLFLLQGGVSFFYVENKIFTLVSLKK
jgi:hypothetical protein